MTQSGMKVASPLGISLGKPVPEWLSDAETDVVNSPACEFQEVLSSGADSLVSSTIKGFTVLQKPPNVCQINGDTPRAPRPLYDAIKAVRLGLGQRHHRQDRMQENPGLA